MYKIPLCLINFFLNVIEELIALRGARLDLCGG